MKGTIRIKKTSGKYPLVLATNQCVYEKLPNGKMIAVSNMVTIDEELINQENLYRYQSNAELQFQDKP